MKQRRIKIDRDAEDRMNLIFYGAQSIINRARAANGKPPVEIPERYRAQVKRYEAAAAKRRALTVEEPERPKLRKRLVKRFVGEQ